MTNHSNSNGSRNGQDFKSLKPTNKKESVKEAGIYDITGRLHLDLAEKNNHFVVCRTDWPDVIIIQTSQTIEEVAKRLQKRYPESGVPRGERGFNKTLGFFKSHPDDYEVVSDKTD